MDESGKWRLSPAYDMGYAYNPQGGWTAMHQMSVNSKFDDITRDDLLAFARQNNIKEADKIIDEVCEATSKWPTLATDSGVPHKTTEVIFSNMLLDF
jgi:serine/threonine-protein kinase HipA